YLLFAGVLLGGLWFNKPFLAIVFDAVFHLTDEGWRKLTLRWAIFFLALAVLNEIVWRTQTTDFWVRFKVFGVVPLTFVFAALQYPLRQKYSTEEKWLVRRLRGDDRGAGRLRDEIGRLQHAEPERRRHREAERDEQPRAGDRREPHLHVTRLDQKLDRRPL